ncbi:hypothetical protein RJZ90_002173 [Blastomyces dermatitidis]
MFIGLIYRGRHTVGCFKASGVGSTVGVCGFDIDSAGADWSNSYENRMGYLERKIHWAEIAQGREEFNHQDARVARPLTIIEQLTLNAREADITAKVGNNWVRLGYQVGVAEPVPSNTLVFVVTGLHRSSFIPHILLPCVQDSEKECCGETNRWRTFLQRQFGKGAVERKEEG